MLGWTELEDPGAVLELVSVVEFGVIGGSVDPHFVDDFEPAMPESANGVSVTAILLAVMLVIALGPDTSR